MGRFTAQPQEEAVEHAVAAAARFSTSGPHLLYADRSPVRGPKPYSTGSLEAVTEPLPCSETWFSTRRATSMARQRRAASRPGTALPSAAAELSSSCRLRTGGGRKPYCTASILMEATAITQTAASSSTAPAIFTALPFTAEPIMLALFTN